MKKTTAVACMLLLLFGLCGVTVFADTNVTVYVSIADQYGNAVLALEAVTVTDIDNDGALTIHDALYLAHEAKYEGGAAAGYAASVGEYGLSMDKLWGSASGSSYGYYLNDASAWNLTDTVKDGDCVSAFVYTDITSWSDTYCYFDVKTVEGKIGKTVTLTLLAAGYDAAFNPITLPVAGATITVDKEATGFKTDDTGKVTITLDKEGAYVISAISDTQTLVPPACKVNVSADENTPSSPATGVDSAIWGFAVVLAALAVIIFIFAIRKHAHEV